MDPDPDVWSKYYGSWERVSVNIWGVQEWLEFIILQTADAKTWGTPEQVALEVGGSADIFAKIRAVAPERLILAGELTSDFQEILKAGLTTKSSIAFRVFLTVLYLLLLVWDYVLILRSFFRVKKLKLMVLVGWLKVNTAKEKQ